ncbi:MAG: hypothetical protein PHT51_04270 [Patescibacteria group bacterium]|nr:hypothetical protein [Patescibacteria group bacterium]MDD4610752.1 hypothetical protein [Patescibacteria group bacterium]
MTKINNKIFIFLILLLVAFGALSAFSYKAYWEEYGWRAQVLEAVSGFPQQDAGVITAFQPGCNESCAGKCCCAFCDGFCSGHNMITYNGQIGGPSASLCVPSSFIYKGGGTIPRPGAYIIEGGIAPRGAMIKVIGISK